MVEDWITITTTPPGSRRQGIKDLRSLIGDHDLDHFFHDRELIVITSENDRDLFNFFFPRSRSFYYTSIVKPSCTSLRYG